MPLWCVIPTICRYDLLERCLDSLFAGSRVPDRVVVVDNGGGFSTRAAVDVIRPAGNIGVGPSWNLGAKLAGDFNLLVLNDDVAVGRETVRRLLDAPGGLVAVNDSWSCFLWRISARRQTGLFDEQFWPAYFEDNDYSYRLKLGGDPHRSIVDPECIHFGSATLAAATPERAASHHAEFIINRARYVHKWGGLPGQETYRLPYGGSLFLPSLGSSHGPSSTN